MTISNRARLTKGGDEGEALVLRRAPLATEGKVAQEIAPAAGPPVEPGPMTATGPALEMIAGTFGVSRRAPATPQGVAHRDVGMGLSALVLTGSWDEIYVLHSMVKGALHCGRARLREPLFGSSAGLEIWVLEEGENSPAVPVGSAIILGGTARALRILDALLEHVLVSKKGSAAQAQIAGCDVVHVCVDDQASLRTRSFWNAVVSDALVGPKAWTHDASSDPLRDIRGVMSTRLCPVMGLRLDFAEVVAEEFFTFVPGMTVMFRGILLPVTDFTPIDRWDSQVLRKVTVTAVYEHSDSYPNRLKALEDKLIEGGADSLSFFLPSASERRSLFMTAEAFAWSTRVDPKEGSRLYLTIEFREVRALREGASWRGMALPYLRARFSTPRERGLSDMQSFTDQWCIPTGNTIAPRFRAAEQIAAGMMVALNPAGDLVAAAPARATPPSPAPAPAPMRTLSTPEGLASLRAFAKGIESAIYAGGGTDRTLARRDIDTVLSHDRGPFAPARRAAVIAACEEQQLNPMQVMRLVPTLRAYEEGRPSGRAAPGDAWSRILSLWGAGSGKEPRWLRPAYEAYERARRLA